MMSQKGSSSTSAVASHLISPEVGDSAASTLALPSAAFVNLSALIPATNKWQYPGATRLANRMAAKVRQCIQADTECYIHVCGIKEDVIESIDRAFKTVRIRSTVRFTYEQDLEALIIKCTISYAHDSTSRSFLIELSSAVASIPGHTRFSILPIGSQTFSSPGKRSKEGDEGIKPTNTRAHEAEWPSVMIEVGYSETLGYLHQDAHWWLENSKGRTRMVIIIQISKAPKSIRIELWEMILNVNQPGTRSRPNKSPGFRYFYVIDRTCRVTHKARHPDLVIPYGTIFDTGLDAGTDITISNAQLSAWALYVFLGLP
ncbi:hypothetical protein B9Z19DRAFT_1163166 [Tuber borchii]|uniref:Uncharacterized protein n=1 Tax=Tuber borchii TaxID=42251 RepID=A0A2T6ZD64_TUBBO|nr:hypothetical protein B9Z19DRAFT_1163166 [Tuber borchii]